MNLNSASKAVSIVKHLKQKGFITIHEIRLSQRGQSSHGYELSDKAYDFLRIKKPEGLSRGGSWEHDFWIFRVSESIKSIYRNFKIHIERQFNDSYVDILVETGKHFIAVEVELSIANVKRNIEKDIESGCFAIMLAHEPGIAENIKNILSEYPEEIRSIVIPVLLYEMLDEEKLRKIFDRFA